MILLTCLLAAWLLSGFSLLAQAGEESLGALFLDEPVGARGAALGESLVGVAEDANAVYWNPAGLVRVGRQELLLAHAQSFQGFRNEYAALLWPWSESTAVGVNALFSYSDAFEKTNAAGEPDGTFSLYDLYAGLSWSHAFTPHLAGGVTVKGLRQVIDTYSAWSAAADISVLWSNVLPDLNLGWVINNLGKPVVFISQNHNLDAFTELGAAYRTWNRDLLLTAALRKPLAQEMVFKAGAELTVLDILALRAGYRAWPSGNYLGAFAGLTLGLGIRISDYTLDYAYTPFPDLGDVHRLTVTLPFGRSVVEEQRMLEKLEKQVKAKQKAIFEQTVSEGDHWTAQGAFDKAGAAYAKAYGMNPQNAGLNKKILQVSLAVKKRTAETHAVRGQKAMSEKDYLTALVEWSKVLELLPEDTTAQSMISAANQKLSAEKLSADSSKNHQLIDQYFQQGLQNLRAGRYDEAMNAWKKIISLEPNNARVTQYLRLTQTKLDDLVEELLRLAQQNWESGQPLEAVKKWRQILDLAPAQPTARAWLESNKAKLAELADQFYRQGVQFYIQNDLDAALTAWQNVLVFDPANKKALDHLEQVKRKRKELNALK